MISLQKPIKIYFFELISHNYLLFSHIIVWFYNIVMILNWNSEENLENFSKISIFRINDS